LEDTSALQNLFDKTQELVVKKKRLHAPGKSKTITLSVFENAWKKETEK